MEAEERIKLFGLSSALAERDLDHVEAALKVDLQRSTDSTKDEEYYPQFDHNNLRPLGYPSVFRVNKVHEFILIFQKPREQVKQRASRASKASS